VVSELHASMSTSFEEIELEVQFAAEISVCDFSPHAMETVVVHAETVVDIQLAAVIGSQ